MGGTNKGPPRVLFRTPFARRRRLGLIIRDHPQLFRHYWACFPLTAQSKVHRRPSFVRRSLVPAPGDLVTILDTEALRHTHTPGQA